MSLKIQGAVWEHSRAQGSDLLVLLAIADNADEETREAFPSIANIAKRCRISERSVRDCLARLKEIGELEVEPRQRKNGSSTSNLFRVSMLPTPPANLAAPHVLAGIPAAEISLPCGDSREGDAAHRSPYNHHLNRHSNHHSNPSEGVNPSAPELTLEPDQPTLNQRIWNQYELMYRSRYRVAPVRNAKVNGMIAQLGKRLGEEAPAVAEFYISHNGQFYVRSCHTVDLLLRDAEKLRTEWASGRRISETTARQADRKQGNLSAYEEVCARRAREAAA